MDEQAALTRNASGISQLLREYDERGQIVKEVERDVDGTTLVSTAYRYDLRGHVSTDDPSECRGCGDWKWRAWQHTNSNTMQQGTRRATAILTLTGTSRHHARRGS